MSTNPGACDDAGGERGGIWREMNLIPRTEAYIEEIYGTLLGRKPDKDGLAHYAGQLDRGELTRPEFVRCLKNSIEYWLGRFPGDVPRLSLENTALNDRETREKRTVLRSRPVVFNIDLIGTCNMVPPCRMCLNWKDGRSPRRGDRAPEGRGGGCAQRAG